MKKKKSTGKKIIVAILIILFIFALFSAFVRCSDSSFSVVINNEVIKSDTTDFEMPAKAEIKINSSNSDNLIFIYAKNANEDFLFTVDGESYSWSEVVKEQMDFSTAFNVTKTEDGFTLIAEPFEKLLSNLYGESVTVSNVPSGDIFEIYIMSGDDTLKISFHLMPATGAIVDPDKIIM